MHKTTFHIPAMDCPAEENLIRLKLEGVEAVQQLNFDLKKRQLEVFHGEDNEAVAMALAELNLGAQKLQTESAQSTELKDETQQRKLLWTVLWINLVFFGLEITTGLISGSMGLVADSLDMLADALVYGLSLGAVGAAMIRKKRVARWAGYLQTALATWGLIEVIRRFLNAEVLPDFQTMLIVSTLALLANSLCLYLLQKSKNKKEAHLQASLIFTSNDVLINLGVIAAALLVHWSQSPLPDLIIGALVFVLVVRGAQRMLKLGQ